MANGQTTVSPAELNGDGLPEILKDPASVPAARAFYSSNPDFIDGAEITPDGIEDIEMAVVSDAAGKSINGREQDVTHALRFIRLKEGREETVQDRVIDYDLAAKGLRWIRKNVKDKDVHRSAVEAKTEIGRHMPDSEPVQQPAGNGHRPVTETSLKSKRAQEREEQRLKEEAQKAELEAQVQAEIELFDEWQKENEPAGTNQLRSILDFFEARIGSDGNARMLPGSKFDMQINSYTTYTAENPSIIATEMRDTDLFRRFLDTHDTPAMSDMVERCLDASGASWKKIAFGNPEKLKAVASQWIQVFKGFSDQYKSKIKVKNYNISNADARKDPDPAVQIEAGVDDWGRWVLHDSIVELAGTHPEKFIDTVYEIMQTAAETNDEYTLNNLLYIFSIANLETGNVNMLLLNGPIASGVSHDERLKCIDLRQAIAEAGFWAGLTYNLTSTLPSKIKERYTGRGVLKTAKSLGIDIREFANKNDIEGLSSEVNNRASTYLNKAIEEGELPGSLLLRIRKQRKPILPENA